MVLKFLPRDYAVYAERGIPTASRLFICPPVCP